MTNNAVIILEKLGFKTWWWNIMMNSSYLKEYPAALRSEPNTVYTYSIVCQSDDIVTVLYHK